MPHLHPAGHNREEQADADEQADEDIRVEAAVELVEGAGQGIEHGLTVVTPPGRAEAALTYAVRARLDSSRGTVERDGH